MHHVHALRPLSENQMKDDNKQQCDGQITLANHPEDFTFAPINLKVCECKI
jgi:hypothetical protein